MATRGSWGLGQVLVLLTVGVGGCYDPRIEERQFVCSGTDPRCPVGFVCDPCALRCLRRENICRGVDQQLAPDLEPPSDDSGEGDQAAAPDLPAEDLSATPDLSVPDLSAPDRAVPSDLEAPDLAGLDLIGTEGGLDPADGGAADGAGSGDALAPPDGTTGG